MQIHFLSGLPRSGSTLLASILAQNPKIRTSISSPVLGLYSALHTHLGNTNEGVDLISNMQRWRVLRGIFLNFYGAALGLEPNRSVIIENSRGWSARCEQLFDLFPSAKMVLLVRPVSEILNSFERVYRADPFLSSRMFGSDSNVTSRVDVLTRAGGAVNYAYNCTKDAFFSTAWNDRLLFVRYATLTTAPARTLESIYRFLELEPFAHDFDNVETIDSDATASFDNRLNMPALHRVRSRVEPGTDDVLLPPDIFNAHADSAFWDKAEFSAYGKVVL